MTSSDDAATAVAKLQKKQSNRARWTKIGGALLAVVFLARAADILFFQHSAPQAMSCSDADVQQTLTNILNKGFAKEGTTFTVKGLSGFATGQHSDFKTECTATLTISDDSKGVVHYNVQSDKVEFEKVSES